jgi:2-polyprenyl-6-methoxyphenol hydroxylase-like FAD-dependent oxidoreductase
MRALIVGGGMGGLAAAVVLQWVGITAAVFEKAPRNWKPSFTGWIGDN